MHILYRCRCQGTTKNLEGDWCWVMIFTMVVMVQSYIEERRQATAAQARALGGANASTRNLRSVYPIRLASVFCRYFTSSQERSGGEVLSCQ